ncbi:O-antigen ligase family protein [Richelia sinica]|uniref:O-antigen ligase family protein n=1 Tax=Richelia sinica TaxID=1357545 RepID=UPI0028C4A3BB|nr:O-antigen ligase family protein [Richelia sinica]
MLITLCAYNLQIICEHKQVKLSTSWWVVAIAFVIFLEDCLVASILSPAGLVRSLVGHPLHRSGLVYWLLIVVFTLTNSLVLSIKPELLKQQIKGFIWGSVILAISIFPQIFHWTIDYTITNGHFYNGHILYSGIRKGYQPIGLYSHRGHAAFVLAAAAAGLLGSWKNKILTSRYLLFLPIIITALLLTQTRAAILALFAAIAFLVGDKRVVGISAIAALILIMSISTTRNIEGIPILNKLTSDRVWIWKMSKDAISENPFGYGMDGFTIAHPQMRNIKKEIIFTPYTKSHNLALDWAISIGISGCILYLLIFGYCFFTNKSPLLAVAIVYLIYTLTWFESGQFTHIAWWVLSLFNYEKNTNNFIFTADSTTSSSVESTARSRVPAKVKRIFRKVQAR